MIYKDKTLTPFVSEAEPEVPEEAPAPEEEGEETTEE